MVDLLKNIAKKPLKVIDSSVSINKYTPVSISSDNPALNSFDVGSSKEWETYLGNYLEHNNAEVAFGGYLEKRDIYKRSSYFNSSDENERNIHLGIDLWCNAGTEVLAVLDGKVHSFNNNLNHGDYGPTIILEHTVNEHVFYSLYGHLSLDSLQSIAVGQTFKAGQQIATLGDSSVNGDYAPHLHFQLIIDIADFKGDYPGVCSASELSYYAQNCPNPNLLLKLSDEI